VYDSLTQTPITRNLLLQPGASSSETVSFYIPYAVYSHPTAPSISASLIGNIERYSYKDIRSYTLPIQVMAPIAYDFTMFLRLEGVADGGAQGAKTIFRFVSNEKNLVTPPVSLAHIGEGIYQARFSVSSAQIPPGKGYTLYVKPEKHLSKKFCKISLQDQACLPGESFSLPEPIAPIIFTLSRFPIEAGDLYPQDNKADLTDFDKIKSLLSKPCGSLTDQEKLTGDLDYNGCVNIRDAFLMRKALETRYDEN
jgi:hypothetical protein